NSLDTLKDILKYGGDISLPDVNGTTALHRAVSEGNVEIVKFLLEQRADMDKPDVYGWTARGLAEHQGHEDIKALFHNQRPVEKKQNFVYGTPEVKSLMKHCSEPVMIYHRIREAMPPIYRAVSQRRKPSNFKNSLFGIMSAANTGEEGGASTRTAAISEGGAGVVYPARVTISGEVSSSGKLVKLPGSLEELIEIGEKKLGFVATTILSREGAEIDDISLIRDGDFLLLLEVS
ncbi:PREDICTED: probable potassium channel AKT5, partial [Camelina sativa]